MAKKSLLTVLLLICSQIGLSQLSIDYTKYKDQYPNSQSIRLKQETVLNIRLEKGAFEITEETFEEDMYFYDNAKYDAKRSLNYSSFFELDEIEASSLVLGNNGYEELKVTDFKEKDEINDSFYDDVKSVNFIFPSLGKGSISKLRYKQTIKNPRFLSAFFLKDFHPIERNKYTIIADKDIRLRFQEFNMEGFEVDFKESQSRKKNIYTWEINKVDELEYEEKAPNYKSILPHIIPIIVSYQNKDKTVRLQEDVSDLYAWYYSLVENLNQDPAPQDLVELVEQLVADKDSELEKVRAIYYWVQENIKYIAFEYALGGFVPRDANDVYKKKYGDCKDNSSLLLQMLEIAGIRGDLTWIGTRSIPYTYSEVPTPSVDNHMILHYEFKGKSYFLDATGRYNPLGMPTSFIQGKEALVSMGKDSFLLKEVPIVEPTINLFNDFGTLELSGNDLIGSGKSELSGYGKINLFYQLERQNSKSEVIDLYNRVFRKGNNSFQLYDYTEKNKYDYDKNFYLSYDFKLPNYAKTLGDEIYVNLNIGTNIISNFKTEEDRQLPLEHKYRDSGVYKYVLKIPSGYKTTYIPEGIELSNEIFDYRINYTVNDTEITYVQSFTLKQLVFDETAQIKVNKLAKQIEKQYKETVVFKKI